MAQLLPEWAVSKSTVQQGVLRSGRRVLPRQQEKFQWQQVRDGGSTKEGAHQVQARTRPCGTIFFKSANSVSRALTAPRPNAEPRLDLTATA